MPLYSSDVLAEMAKNDLQLVVEYGAPRGRLKNEVITLRAEDGSHIELKASTFSGCSYSSNLVIPHAFLDDYRREGLVRVETRRKSELTVYVLTDDGRARGLAQVRDSA